MTVVDGGTTLSWTPGGTIAGGTKFTEYKEKLDEHGIHDKHLHRINENKTTTDGGRLSIMIYRLGGRLSIMIHSLQQEPTIPYDKWYTLLVNPILSMTLLDNTFKHMIVELQKTDIHTDHYYKTLIQNTVSIGCTERQVCTDLSPRVSLGRLGR